MAIAAFIFPIACSYFPVVRAGYTLCYDNKYCPDGYYCCGDQCCAYVWSYWYFWCGLAFFLFAVLSGIITACKRCRANRRRRNMPPRTITFNLTDTNNGSSSAQQMTSYPPPEVSSALPPYYPRSTTTDHRTPATQASREQCDNPGLLYDEFLADLRPIRPGEKPPPYSLYPPEYHGDPTTIPSSQLTSGQNNRGQLQHT
ncbi:PREDICTED: uncharacterized protein LOC109466039 isoform X2 [Branchiostoma belcheri]|uniref:Uncharacterized protein LOC109466039 isoform X2 n=1 Tax=Branchiostoma belcheri TaxID=7741 RepID=A0A6P4Y427_BRABE|nr:PREDICTED: uncharacterized protein LOC109466039 isoform X2 [Branchiostoma belcheri]